MALITAFAKKMNEQAEAELGQAQVKLEVIVYIGVKVDQEIKRLEQDNRVEVAFKLDPWMGGWIK